MKETLIFLLAPPPGRCAFPPLFLGDERTRGKSDRRYFIFFLEFIFRSAALVSEGAPVAERERGPGRRRSLPLSPSPLRGGRRRARLWRRLPRAAPGKPPRAEKPTASSRRDRAPPPAARSPPAARGRRRRWSPSRRRSCPPCRARRDVTCPLRRRARFRHSDQRQHRLGGRSAAGLF